MPVRFRFVHAADLHLDTPFSGIGRAAPDVAEALREASLQAFDGLIDHTLRVGASFLLLAGDLYDGPEHGLRAQRRLQAGLERLDAAGIRVFIVHGNHDPLSGWSAIREWPGSVTVFPAGAVGSETVVVEGQPVATVHGISFAEPAEPRNLARLFRRSGEGIQVGIVHSNVGSEEHAPYAPCSVQDLRDAGMDYWALGHVHRFSMPLEGGPWAVYPGVLQGRHPAASEQGPKGAVLVECDTTQGIVGAPQFFALDRVRFSEASVEAGPEEGILRILDRALADVMQQHAAADGRGIVSRILITGATTAHEELARRAATGELLQELRSQVQGVDPFVWLDEAAVRTAPMIDREVVRSRGDFGAELVSLVDALHSDGAARADAMDRLLAEFPGGGRALVQRGLVPQLTERSVMRAEAECLRLLTGDEAE